MYVDTVLYDIKAVQTLSRLNRCCPKKYDTFVLDFANKPEMIQESFSRYYRTTILSGETDPNKLYDLVATMENTKCSPTKMSSGLSICTWMERIATNLIPH